MPNAAHVKTKLARNYIRPAASVVVIIISLCVARMQTNFVCQEVFREDSVITTAQGQQIGVEIAAEEVALQEGLSNRACLPQNSGMLFSFNQPGDYSFWMKDMQFPLDILWLNTERKIIKISYNIQPQSYPQTFSAGNQTQYVLELAAGAASAYGVQTGDQMQF